MAMEAMNASPASTVYIGDSPSDIVAAHNAGVFGIAALWGYHKKEDFPPKATENPICSSASLKICWE